MPDEIRRALPDELVDELLAGARTEEEIVGPGGLLSQLTKRLVEGALEVELTDHLGYEPVGRRCGVVAVSREREIETVSGPVLVGVAVEGHHEPAAVGVAELDGHIRRCETAFEQEGCARVAQLVQVEVPAAARTMWADALRDGRRFVTRRSTARLSCVTLVIG